jgi:hypothetical protein
MSGPFTNRDLYLHALAFRDRADGMDRTLEAYLLALWALVRPLRGEPALSVETFIRLLDEALAAPAPPFPDRWRDLPDDVGPKEPPGFPRWEGQIIQQIRDLREMDEAGMLTGPGMYLVTAPRGKPWYHPDPGPYVEAGIAYHFGGWEREGEELLAEDVFPMDEITWHDFTEFLLEARWNE